MNTSQTVYELGYLLVPTLSEKEVSETITGLEKTIASTGGSVTTKGATHFIDLAYEMVKKIKTKNVKFDQAHFGWVKFTADPETPAKLEKAIKNLDDVLRVIVVKTVEDDAVTDLFVSEEMMEAEESNVDVNEGVDMGKEEEKTEDTKESSASDDLTKIEGIGPKIAETLTDAGVSTFAELAKTDTEKIDEIIADVRGSHDAGTWPKQAGMAAEGKWDELKTWQDEMDGGKE